MKLYPSKLISLIKEIPSKRSTKESSGRPDGRKGLFSSFARLPETAPAVDVSRGAPFEMDIEKNQGLDSVSDEKEISSSSSNPLHSLCQQILNKWLRSGEGWKAFREGLILGYWVATKYRTRKQSHFLANSSREVFLWTKAGIGATNGDRADGLSNYVLLGRVQEREAGSVSSSRKAKPKISMLIIIHIAEVLSPQGQPCKCGIRIYAHLDSEA